MGLMSDLLAYLRSRRVLLLFFGIAVATTLVLQQLAGQDMTVARYAVVLQSFALVLILLVDGARFVRRRRAVAALAAEALDTTRTLPEPGDALEADYVRLLADLGSAYDELKRRLACVHGDSLEYYTLWVHQIKTPIAALGLVLSQMDGDEAGIFRQELFKIEQYTDMALRYVKLADISSDLVIESCDLGQVVYDSVRKFGVLFVYQKLTVDIGLIERTVTSDKRWLGFIVEQVLSNALKYTPAGGVRIYLDDAALVLEDTGIGIRPEDLPRIFAKGYTGYNGRLDGRASGIGLYLAKKAADALGITLRVSSQVGVGTRVSLVFPRVDTDIFR